MDLHPSISLFCHPHEEHIMLYNYVLDLNYLDFFNEGTVEFPHSHSGYYEIYYVEEGILLLMIDGKDYHIHQGEFALISPGISHGAKYMPMDHKKYFVFIFNFYKKNSHTEMDLEMKYEEMHINSFLQFMEKRTHHIHHQLCNNINKNLEILEQEFQKKEFGWEFIIRTQYVHIIVLFLRNIIESENLETDVRMTNIAVAITKYMHENYEHPITIEDIANHFSITKRHVNRLFNDYFGTSPRKTLTRYRLNYAKNYLIETDFNLDVIAEKVGISSASILSRLFRETEGMTITQFRETRESAGIQT